MPELPEVQGYKVYIDSTILHKKITSLDCRDKKLLKQPYGDFEKHLVGEQLTSTQRIGKYLFIKTTGEKVLVMHFEKKHLLLSSSIYNGSKSNP